LTDQATDAVPYGVAIEAPAEVSNEDATYASRIWQAGGTAELHVWPGGFHGFDTLVPEAALSVDARAAKLRRLLGQLAQALRGRLNASVSDYWTPAHHAVEHEDVETLARLLADGSDPDEVFSNMTLLTQAIDVEGDGSLQSGQALTVHTTAVLPAFGADPELADPDGRTPMDMARHYDHGPAVSCCRPTSAGGPSMTDEGPGDAH
jgi:hypothetical protein